MARSNPKWPFKAKESAIELHSTLKLDNNNWHQLKGDSERRAAELISGAMVQLISGGKSSEIEALLNQSLKWIKQEVKDPGCPHH